MNKMKILEQAITYHIALYAKGQFREVLNIIVTLRINYPYQSLLYNISAACYAGLGELNRAIMSYKQALEVNPNYDKALYIISIVLKDEKRNWFRRIERSGFTRKNTGVDENLRITKRALEAIHIPQFLCRCRITPGDPMSP
jgi:tetratricopeptide (TPR) repeat protein